MYLYQIGYGTCEESASWELRHDKLFSDEELERVMEACMFEVMNGYAGEYDDEGFQRIYTSDRGVSFQSLMDDKGFIDALKGRGFSLVQYQAAAGVFGWASSTSPGDWETYCSDKCAALQERMKARADKAGIVVEEHYPKDEDEPGGVAKYPCHRLARKAQGMQPSRREGE